MDGQQGDTKAPEHNDAVPLQAMTSSTSRRSPASPARSAKSNTNSHSSANAGLRHRRPTIADRREPSIRLRRLPSSINLRSDSKPLNQTSQPTNARTQASPHTAQDGEATVGNRRRSSSEPQRMQYSESSVHLAPDTSHDFARSRARGMSSPMPPLDEEAARYPSEYPFAMDGDVPHEVARRPGILTRASTAARSALGMTPMNNYNERRRLSDAAEEPHEYENGLVDFLDVVDPEIATLSTLTNVQNSLFVPDLGHFLNRRPTYTFTRDPTIIPEVDTSAEQTETEDDGDRPNFGRSITITSCVNESEGHYAVLPHGISLKGWSPAEKDELNDHVRHLLHSRRAAFKRSMKGFGQYVRRRTFPPLSPFHFAIAI